MSICRAITPQFYRGLKDEDVRAEKLSIELLTGNIDSAVLAKMCELAVTNYARARSEDKNTYFNINYLLTFFKQAFNLVWCNGVELPPNAEYASGEYDYTTNTLTELWQLGGEKIIIKYITAPPKRNCDHTYSPKYYDMLTAELSQIKL